MTSIVKYLSFVWSEGKKNFQPFVFLANDKRLTAYPLQFDAPGITGHIDFVLDHWHLSPRILRFDPVLKEEIVIHLVKAKQVNDSDMFFQMPFCNGTLSVWLPKDCE